MFSKVIILLWERWQRTRWALIAACLLPLIGRLLWVPGHTTLEHAVIFTIKYLYPGYTLLIMFLLVGQCEARHLDLAFSNRLFRLPVRTITLVIVYMGYGVVAVLLPFLILFGFENLFFDTISYEWSTLLILETLYIILQTLSWLGGPARFLYLALSLTGVYTLLRFAAMFDLPLSVNTLCQIVILLCGAISFWSVSKHRQGAWINGWQWVGSFLGMFRKRTSKPFTSALHAQIWFELRQTGYLFPLAALCLIGLLLGYMAGLEVYDKLFVGMALTFPVTLLITIPAAFFAGLLVLAVYHRDHVSGASIFWLRRPMSTQSLAVARMHAMAWSLARVLAILPVVMLAVLAHDYMVFGMQDVKALSHLLSPVKWTLKYSSPLETATMTVLGLYGFVLFYWTLFRLGPILWIGGLGLNILTFIPSMIWGWQVVMLWVFDTLVIGLPIGVLASFYVARYRNLITTTTLLISACVFPIVVVSLWAFPWWSAVSVLPKGLPDLNQTQIIRLISAATLPFIPVVATPLIMERLRHR